MLAKGIAEDLAFRIPDENGGKIMAGKNHKNSDDFAPHDFANFCIPTLPVSPQARRQ
jgi:hypothetical protein